MSSRSLTEHLAFRTASDVGEDDRAAAAVHLHDWIGAVAAAATRPEGAAVAAYTRSQGSGPATAVGAGSSSESGAAFHNAALAIALELDSNDREAKLHAGPVVIAAALAVAEATGASGTALLDAVVRGYEAAVRVGRSVGPAHYHFFHNTSTCGGFGAAAAVASLLGLDTGTTAHALGLAGTTAGGFWQVRFENATAKLVHAGRAAEAGVSSARLARSGLTAPLRVLEGERGLYAATAPDSSPAAVLADLDGPWLLHESSLKPWACCRHAHPAIDAALELHAALDGEPVVGVEVHAYADALGFCDRPVPTTSGQARFSLQHVVACALLDGEVEMPAFDEPAISRSDVADLRRRVQLNVDPRLEAAYPRSWGATVTVRTPTRELTARRDEAKGDPLCPLSDEEVEAKTRRLLEVWSADPSLPDRITQAVQGLRDGAPVRSLTAVLRQAAARPQPEVAPPA
jgi:2-methylcitrate dehydratase PrpD